MSIVNDDNIDDVECPYKQQMLNIMYSNLKYAEQKNPVLFPQARCNWRVLTGPRTRQWNSAKFSLNFSNKSIPKINTTKDKSELKRVESQLILPRSNIKYLKLSMGTTSGFNLKKGCKSGGMMSIE